MISQAMHSRVEALARSYKARLQFSMPDLVLKTDESSELIARRAAELKRTQDRLRKMATAENGQAEQIEHVD